MARQRGRTAQKNTIVASGTALALGALAAGQPAEAANFQVTNLDDNGAGSLRQAIVDANTAAGADTVTFQAGLTGTITLTSGELFIGDSLDIQGPGPEVITVDGNDASRVFYVYNAGSLLDVSISGLTITRGLARLGAGVVNWGENLVLDDVVVTGNTATGQGGGFGGGVASVTYNDPGTLTVRDSVISGNSAGFGGGFFLYAVGVLIQNTVIADNDATSGGAGIFVVSAQGDMTIETSILSGNDSVGVGGGIVFYDPDGGGLTIRDTTISGNTAALGGGLFLLYAAEAVTVENSTISGNQATEGPGGGIFSYYSGPLTLRHATISGNSASVRGGGIYLYSYGDGTALDNTIVANNTATADPDLATGQGSFFDLRSSLIESPGTANINDNGGNILNQDPQLGPLQNNGGPTLTHLPDFASPVVDAGNSAFTVDQRGQARPVGTAVDMGAVEVNPGTIQLTVSAVNVNENGVTVTITATRTGGSDGAVSVSYSTSPGTAVSPDDFAAAAGTLDWADGDAAPKTFQVTIVDDLLDEPDETFTTSLSAPTGGAALGSPATATVTILDDDVLSNVVEIPTLGGVGKILLGALVGLAGFLLLRRR